MKLKKIVLILLAIIIVLSLCACGTKANVDTPNSEIAERDKAIEEAVKKRQEQIAEQKEKSTPTPTPAPTQKIETSATNSKGIGFYDISDAENAYNEAANLHAPDLIDKGYKNYRYKSNKFKDGLTLYIDENDYSMMGSKPLFVYMSALYNAWTNAATSVIKDWKNEKDSERYIVEATIGTIPGEPRKSTLERLNSFCELMPPNIDDMALLNMLNERGVISNLKKSGETVEYDINDIKGSAETLGISERMLGYVIAYIGGIDSIINDKATFGENSVHVSFIK